MTSLRQRMIEDMQIRNLTVHTQNTYVLQVSMFAHHFSKSSLKNCQSFLAPKKLCNFSRPSPVPSIA